MDKGHLSAVSAIALNAIFGNEPRIAKRIVEVFGSAESVFALSDGECRELFGPCGKFSPEIGRRALREAEAEYGRLSSLGVKFVSIFDDGVYPPLLRECPDAPLLLYLRCGANPRDVLRGSPMVSIVGTRDMSAYGKEWCARTVKALSEYPVKPVIVSGLAFGVDITAHLAALGCSLPTIAVIPVGIDEVYPRRHSVVADKIASSDLGALVTDYPPGTEPLPYNFLRRNRIIAGLSAATVLIESRVRGGGMMTSRLAFGYGRSVFALPGRVDDPRSGGCNSLIAEKVAEPLVSAAAVAEAAGLGRAVLKEKRDPLAVLRERLGGSLDADSLHRAEIVFAAVRGRRDISVGELSAALGFSYSEALRTVGLLEGEGIIRTDVLQRCSINADFA